MGSAKRQRAARRRWVSRRKRKARGDRIAKTTGPIRAEYIKVSPVMYWTLMGWAPGEVRTVAQTTARRIGLSTLRALERRGLVQRLRLERGVVAWRRSTKPALLRVVTY